MIEVKNLTERFGQLLAADNLSFEIGEGEIVGFLGPNGAGKTTTMNMLAGYTPATCGRITINGFDMLSEPENAKRHIGYLPDTPPVYGEMTVDEYLRFVAGIKKIKAGQKQQMIDSVKETLHITEMSKRLIRNLSKGYRQRVGLAQAMLGDPKVLILDEPTVGLDPKQIIEMRGVITGLGKKHTVIFSSHNLSEVSNLCDRVIIINNGKIIAGDTPEKLSESLTRGRGTLVRVKGEREAIQEAFAGEPAVARLEFDEAREPGAWDILLFGAEGADIREAVFTRLSQSNLPVLMMKPTDLTLEEIFLQMTGNNPEEEGAEDSPESKAEGGDTVAGDH